MNAAATLREHRLRSGITQAELARRAGTSQATVSAYEAGRKQPTVETYGRLLAALGAHLEVAPGAPARRPSAAELRRRGRTLIEVIGLAAALPTRHEPGLSFPRLPAAGGTR
jgi:transcriptional regulator with XRE-family HTH domain